MIHLLRSWRGAVGLILLAGLLLVLLSSGSEHNRPPDRTLHRLVRLMGACTIEHSSQLPGTLTDPSGNPISATVSMEFALYDASVAEI